MLKICLFLCKLLKKPLFMKKTLLNLTLAAVVAFGAFTTTSCGKEKGCTDKRADNYNASAEEDDDSCNETATVGKFLGDYNVIENSDGQTYNYEISIVRTSSNDPYKVRINNLGDFQNTLSPRADVEKSDLKINDDVTSGGLSYKVTGTLALSSSGNQLNGSYNVTVGANTIQGTISATKK
jgi:hypothetical protein